MCWVLPGSSQKILPEDFCVHSAKECWQPKTLKLYYCKTCGKTFLGDSCPNILQAFHVLLGHRVQRNSIDLPPTSNTTGRGTGVLRKRRWCKRRRHLCTARLYDTEDTFVGAQTASCAVTDGHYSRIIFLLHVCSPPTALTVMGLFSSSCSRSSLLTYKRRLGTLQATCERTAASSPTLIQEDYTRLRLERFSSVGR